MSWQIMSYFKVRISAASMCTTTGSGAPIHRKITMFKQQEIGISGPWLQFLVTIQLLKYNIKISE